MTTSTAQSAEPTAEELLAACDRAINKIPLPGETLGEIQDICAIARALRSRLSHPTLSADRLAEIQKRNDELQKQNIAQYWTMAERDRAELLAALKQ